MIGLSGRGGFQTRPYSDTLSVGAGITREVTDYLWQ